MTHEPVAADLPDPPRPSNRMASAAATLGVLSCLGGVTAIPGVICGVIGWRAARKFGGTGKGTAVAGIVMSCVGLVVLGLGYFAVQRVRAAAERMVAVCHLKCLGLSIHNYNDAHEHLPSPFARDPKAPFVPVPENELASKLSWRVSILPFIEEQRVYEQMVLDQPWDSPTNRPFAAHIIRTFTDPDTKTDPDTRYRVFYGPDTAFPLDRLPKWQNITDGASTTILLVESGNKVTWTQFNELKFDPSNPPDPATMGRPNSSVFVVAMTDGSVRTFRKTMNPQVFKAAITPNGGEVVNFDD